MAYFGFNVFKESLFPHLCWKPKNDIEISDYVLQNFDEDEAIGIEKISENITDSLSILVEKKLDLFSSTVNNK